MNLRSLCLLLILPIVAHADDWPQFLGPQRDGVSKETGILKNWPKDGPPVAFQKPVGEGFSGPVVAGGKLIVFHRVGAEEIVACWDAQSGKALWSFAYPTQYQDGLGKGDGPRSTPTIDNQRVLTLGAEGKLHCLQLNDGKALWSRDLTKDYAVPQSFFGVGTSPLVIDGRVLINVGGKKAGIVAFSLEDGSELWRATGDAASYASPIVYRGNDKPQAIFFTREGAVILDPAKGEVLFQKRWRARYAASVNAATPLLLGDRVFFSTCYETGALILKLGKKIEDAWSGEEVMDSHYNTAVVFDGHLYGYHGRQEAKPGLRCVDLKTMKVKWGQDRFGCGSMLLVDGRIISLLETGEMLLIEPTPEKYREVARFSAFEAPPCRAQIGLADGRLYARDEKTLRCWDMRGAK